MPFPIRLALVLSFRLSQQLLRIAPRATGSGLANASLTPISRVAIRCYRRHLSPRKGFVCPHRLVHGGPSCSGFFLDELANSSWSEAMAALPARFEACRAARRTLASDTPDPGRDDDLTDANGDADGERGGEPGDEIASTEKRWKRRRRGSSRPGGQGQDRRFEWCDGSGDCGCGGPDCDVDCGP